MCVELFEKATMVFANRWIPGPERKDAIKKAEELLAENQKSTINYLREGITDKALVGKATGEYITLLSDPRMRRLECDVAVKATQLGICVNESLFRSNYEKIVSFAETRRIFVWLDMENSEYVDATINAYIHVLKKHKNVGIAIQSKIRRSYHDAKMLVKHGGIIRIVKGAYKENARIAYTERKQIDANYIRIMEYLFRNSKKFMIATHDYRIIRKAMALQRRYKRDITFSMLNGIRRKLAEEIANKGYETRIYVPYGKEWFAFAWRRFKEGVNTVLMVRSMLNM